MAIYAPNLYYRQLAKGYEKRVVLAEIAKDNLIVV